MPKGGRLVFKGGEVAVSSRGKKKDKLKRKRERALAKAGGEGGQLTSGGDEGDGSGGGAAGDSAGGKPEEEEEEMRPVSGTGRITSSGTAVQGHEAKFMDELHSGDALLISHPTT